MFDGIYFYSDCSTEKSQIAFKYLGINFIKLILHHVEIVDWKGQHLTLILALNSKLPFQTVSMRNPIINIKLELTMAHETADDARDTEMIALVQINVF